MTQRYVHIDDVYITGIVAAATLVPRYDVPGPGGISNFVFRTVLEELPQSQAMMNDYLAKCCRHHQYVRIV